jgi:hypothetical protein
VLQRGARQRGTELTGLHNNRACETKSGELSQAVTCGNGKCSLKLRSFASPFAEVVSAVHFGWSCKECQPSKSSIVELVGQDNAARIISGDSLSEPGVHPNQPKQTTS